MRSLAGLAVVIASTLAATGCAHRVAPPTRVAAPPSQAAGPPAREVDDPGSSSSPGPADEPSREEVPDDDYAAAPPRARATQVAIARGDGVTTTTWR